MSGKPAARLGDPTACPLPGHGSNPIVGGSPDVFFDHLSAARQGDATACGATLSANVIVREGEKYLGGGARKIEI